MKLRLISLFIVIILLVGCGDRAGSVDVESNMTSENDENSIDTNNTETNSKNTDNNDTISSTSKDADEEHTPSLKPVTGGTLKIAMKKPETLNPLLNRDDTVDKVLRLMFEPLFIIDSEMKVTPNIADSYNILQDGKCVLVKLKSDLKWQDGTAITANDMIYSLDILKEAQGDSIYKHCYNNIKNYNKVDNLTVQINYNEGVGAIAYNLCFPLIPKAYYNGNEQANMKPMGNGFYKFEAYETAKNMSLTASNSFKGTPYITNIVVNIIPNYETQLSALNSGVIDAVVVDINNLGAVKNNISDNTGIYSTNLFEYIGLNNNKAIFADLNSRQAIACLVPFDDIISNIYINKMTKSITPINPNSPYYGAVGLDNYNKDSNIANTLILASGFTKADFSFTILVNSENAARIESAKLMSQAFNSEGLNTRVEAVSFADYKKRLEEGNFDMFLGGIKLSDTMNTSFLIGTDGNANYGRYSNPLVDNLINTANIASDDEAYKRAIAELNKFISAELPVIGIGFKSEVLATSKRVKGIKQPTLNNVYGNIDKWFISE